MIKFVHLVIIISAAFLLMGNGITVTFIVLKANALDYSAFNIGLLGSFYYLGLLLGGYFTLPVLRNVGHIRCFSAACALFCICALIIALIHNDYIWYICRIFMGISLAAATAVGESWLNQSSTANNRGRILSLYKVVDLGVVTLAQMIIPLFSPLDAMPFIIAGILFACAIIPVSLARVASPTPPLNAVFHPFLIWRMSPLAAYGLITIGFTGASFRTIGPVYAEQQFVSIELVAIFMTIGIASAAIAQYPLGMLSDRYPRRAILLLATFAASLSSLGMVLSSNDYLFILIGLFGATALPLYALSAAHANDRVRHDQMAELSLSLMVFWSIGAIIGPLIIGLFTDMFGYIAYPIILFIAHFSLGVFTVIRMMTTIAPLRKKRFLVHIIHSPVFNAMTLHYYEQKRHHKHHHVKNKIHDDDDRDVV